MDIAGVAVAKLRYNVSCTAELLAALYLTIACPQNITNWQWHSGNCM
jgi:hypothetical protein